MEVRDYLRIYLDDMPLDLHYFGRAHTDGDIVIYLPTLRLLIAGDMFALYGPYQPVIDYSAGGSLRDWTRTLERALQLDFDTVIPGHSGLTDRATMKGYVDELARTQDMVREMNARETLEGRHPGSAEDRVPLGRLGHARRPRRRDQRDAVAE